MNDQRFPLRAAPRADAAAWAPSAPHDLSADPSGNPSADLNEALAQAQARRIQELEQRLAERSRVLTDAAQALAGEIRRREQAQAVLFEAQKLETLGHLAGGLAHDLRNMMGVIALGYQILQQTTTEPGVLKVTDSGNRALNQAQRLIDSLLNLIRRREDRPQVIAPARWLAQQEDLLGYAVGYHATCRLQIAPDVWPVSVQEPRLGAALINLAVNARDALVEEGEPGEILVTVDNLPRGAPRPASVPEGDFVVFSVIDNGCGMSAAVLARATEPLFSTKPPDRGTGLGLSMVQGFALDCTGHLAIASTPGAGTRVAIYVPRGTGNGTANATGDAAGAAPGAAPAPRSAGGTLLLVEDDDLLRPTLAGNLREAGYEVVESSSAEVALALLHTLPRLALVVADLVLPGLDGPTLVQRLRLERPGLPAVLMTGDDLPGPPLSEVALLTKPIDPQQLQGAVRAALQQPRSPRQTQAALLDRLIVRLRAPELLAALLAWRAALGRALLPGIAVLNAFPATLTDRMFVAFREGEAPDGRFRYLSAGPALTELLGRPLHGEPVAAADEDLVGTLAAAYQRAARTGLPSYEYARYTLGDGPPVLFERLILPVSRDGEQVSQLIGLVLFANLPATGTPAP